MQVSAFQFLDFHAGVVGPFLQDVLDVLWKIDDHLFARLVLIAGQQRARADAPAEDFDYLRVFDELFAQGLYRFDAPKLEGVCLAGESL